MTQLVYTNQKPTVAGWYWCRNIGEHSGRIWEAIVRVDRTGDGLMCAWLAAPGQVGFLHESQWSTETVWAGPLQQPTGAAFFHTEHGTVVQRLCQRQESIPCVANIRILAGLVEPCEVCAAAVPKMRAFQKWKPMGEFWMSDRISLEQQDRLLDEINATRAQRKDG